MLLQYFKQRICKPQQILNNCVSTYDQQCQMVTPDLAGCLSNIVHIINHFIQDPLCDQPLHVTELLQPEIPVRTT